MTTDEWNDAKEPGTEVRGTAALAEPNRPAVVVFIEGVSEEVAAVILQSRHEALVGVAVSEFMRRLRLDRAEAPGAAQAVAGVAGENR